MNSAKQGDKNVIFGLVKWSVSKSVRATVLEIGCGISGNVFMFIIIEI